MFPSDPNDVPKKRPVPAEPRRQIAISEPPASKNIGQDDGAQQNQHYISQLRKKLLDDFKTIYLPKLLDDFEKTFLQRSNSSDPTACLEEFRITALVLKGVPQHVKEHYEWSLMPGKLSPFKKLENVPLTGLTPQSEDQSITEGCTHTPEENSVHTTNDAKEATRVALALGCGAGGHDRNLHSVLVDKNSDSPWARTSRGGADSRLRGRN